MEHPTDIPGVVMVDDNVLATTAMERRFTESPDLRWLGSTSDPSAALGLVGKLSPAVLLLDVDMPGVDTIALLRQLLVEHPDVAVVMFSGLDRIGFMEQALNEGAAGYIHKDEPTAVIVNLIRRAARGDYVLSPLASQIYMRG